MIGPRIRQALLMSFLLMALAGCQSFGSPEVNERLDEVTGTTLLTEREPLIFARGQPQYSRSARDYVYLGPVEINRQGRREYYLWVGLASTIDRDTGSTGSGEVLFIESRGELMELPLEPWSALLAGLDHVDAYDPVLDPSEQYGVLVTLDGVDLQEIYLQEPPARSRRYVRWSEEPGGWSAFIREAGGSTTLRTSQLELQ